MQRRALLVQLGFGAWAGLAHAEGGYDVKPWSATRALPRQVLSEDGKAPLQLADFHGRAVLINFWASWCEPCRQEMPSLQKLATTRAQELVVLTVNFKDASANVETFIAQTGLKLPVLRDPEGVTAQAFPLARVLEGGSWAAGRRIAASLRPDLSPPIAVISDGTVF